MDSLLILVASFFGSMLVSGGLTYGWWQHYWRKRQPVEAPPPPPEINIEFVDAEGAPVGMVTMGLVLQLTAHGLVISTNGPVEFVASHRLTMAGWQVWVGSQCLEMTFPQPVEMDTNAHFRLLEVKIPVITDGMSVHGKVDR